MAASRVRAYLLILAATAIWGVAGVVIKLTLKELSPLNFLVYRFFLSAMFSVLLLGITKPKLPSKINIALLLVAFGLLAFPLAIGSLFIGLNQSTLLTMSLFTLSVPLVTSLAGVVFLKERITKKEKIGTMIAILGTMVTLVKPILESGASAGSLYGNVFLLLYVIFDVSSAIILKKLLKKGVDPMVITNLSMILAFVFFVPLIIPNLASFSTEISSLPLLYHLGVFYMAIFSGNIAYALRTYGQKTIEVSEAGLFGYLVPIFTVPLAVFLLHEEITALFIIGAIIIATGVVIAEFKKR